MKTALKRIHQIAAIAMLVLVMSLAWRTGIQPAIVHSSHFESAVANACYVADGCAGIFTPTVRYDQRLGAWVPVVRVSLEKGKHNTAVIKQKMQAAIDEAAKSGAWFLRDARLQAGVTFQ